MRTSVSPGAGLLASTALTGFVACLLATACSGGSVVAPFTIVSPSSQTVVVMPGESVRFEIRTSGGRTVEYVIDDIRTEPGPVFVFLPTSQHHVVRALISDGSPTSMPEVVSFTVDVEVPGNLPPSIGSFTVEPQTGSAGTTEFTARVVASDADGTIQSLTIDWGDNTAPAAGSSSPFTAVHVYSTQGTYTLTARAVDDDGVPVSTIRQLTVEPHNDPPTGSLHSALLNGGPPQGTGPLMIQLVTQGVDPDGSIATWEIDKDLGDGFELIAPAEIVTASYPFREMPYRPVLRLTDDRGLSTEIEADQTIVVLRDVSAANSSYTVTGNPRFDSTEIAPAIWADGQDLLHFNVQLRGTQGEPVEGARVRVSTTRPDLVAPDGTNLGPVTTAIPNSIVTTDASGLAAGSIVTGTSTRVEAMPAISFQPFALVFEVDVSQDLWMPLALDAQPLNANTTVDGGGGRVDTDPSLVCPGEQLTITVEAVNKSEAPGSGAAGGKYTELRYGTGMRLPGHHPVAGFSNWRTDAGGTIRFVYTPMRADQSQLFIAWVDGQPLDDLGTIFLRSPGECGGN